MRIEIRLTTKCNFNCEYCDSLHNNNIKDQGFDFKGFQKVLVQFQSPEIFIYGGEPTLHKDFLELIDFITKESPDSDIIIQTNLSHPDKIPSGKNIKVNASWHSSNLSFKKFLLNVNKIEDQLVEISFMDSSDEIYKYYRLLKKLYPGLVQFCPIIDSDIYKSSSTKRLKDLKHKEIFKEIQNDWHFVKHKSGLSNYDYWDKDINKNKNKKCSVKKNVIYTDEKYIYSCFNGLFFEPKLRTPFENYQHKSEIITCPYETCFFGMEYWENE